MSENWYINRKFQLTSSEAESRLIKKLYRKLFSLYNRGMGPKPDLDSLIQKSRIKHTGLVENIKTKLHEPGEDFYRGHVVGKRLNFPIQIKLDFIKECKPSPGFYILIFDNGLKFGKSINIKRRMKYYEKPWSANCIERWFSYMDSRLARDLEVAIQREYSLSYGGKGSSEFITTVTSTQLMKYLKSITLKK